MDTWHSPIAAVALPGKAYPYALNPLPLRSLRPGLPNSHGAVLPGVCCCGYTPLTMPMRTRLAMALEPLVSGRPLATMLHSAVHGGLLVDLWIQTRPGGFIQVDAIVPMRDYKVLFKERHDTAGPAIASWRGHYLALFGVDPLE